jgi:signal transduction histidine kinase
LAKLLHDELQQLLFAARLRVANAVGAGGAAASTTLKAADELICQCMTFSRDLTNELSPPALRRGTFGGMLRRLAGWFREKYGLSVAVEAEEQLPRAQEAVRVFIFQALRELLFNVVKHSGVKEAAVTLSSSDDYLLAKVEDVGKTFDPRAVRQRLESPNGFGLFSIQQRLEAFGGRMEIENAPGGGACFRLIVPLRAAEAAERALP